MENWVGKPPLRSLGFDEMEPRQPNRVVGEQRQQPDRADHDATGKASGGAKKAQEDSFHAAFISGRG